MLPPTIHTVWGLVTQYSSLRASAKQSIASKHDTVHMDQSSLYSSWWRVVIANTTKQSTLIILCIWYFLERAKKYPKNSLSPQCLFTHTHHTLDYCSCSCYPQEHVTGSLLWSCIWRYTPCGDWWHNTRHCKRSEAIHSDHTLYFFMIDVSVQSQY